MGRSPPNGQGKRSPLRAFHAAKAVQRDFVRELRQGAALVLRPGCRPALLTVARVERGKVIAYIGGGAMFRVNPKHIDHDATRAANVPA